MWEVLCGEGMVWGEFSVWRCGRSLVCGGVGCGMHVWRDGVLWEGQYGREVVMGVLHLSCKRLCCFRGVATTYVSLGERQHLVLDLVGFNWSFRDY